MVWPEAINENPIETYDRVRPILYSVIYRPDPVLLVPENSMDSPGFVDWTDEPFYKSTSPFSPRSR